MLSIVACDGDNKPDHQGEREISRNTIAQGMPDCFGEPVVITLVCFFHSHTRLRVRGSARHFLRPLLPRDTDFAQLGRIKRRGKAALCVIACDKREAFAQGSVSDEAIQTLGAIQDSG